MPTYIALLRAVNVGGTGKLPIAELEAMCVAASKRLSRTASLSGASHSAGRTATLPVRSLAGRWPRPSPLSSGC